MVINDFQERCVPPFYIVSTMGFKDPDDKAYDMWPVKN